MKHVIRHELGAIVDLTTRSIQSIKPISPQGLATPCAICYAVRQAPRYLLCDNRCDSSNRAANYSMSLIDDQLRTLEIIERSASVLSVISIVTIIGTFQFSRHFRNPIHRLILINAFYNVFDVTATFISISGPKAGNSSALCQFQGFLMQMYELRGQSHPNLMAGTPGLTKTIAGFHSQMCSGHWPWPATFSLSSSMGTMLELYANSRSSILVSSQLSSLSRLLLSSSFIVRRKVTCMAVKRWETLPLW